MRITLVGSGAMGQLFGARLTLAGQDVVLVDAQQAVIDRLNSAGIGMSVDRVTATLANAFEHHGSHKSSMLVDREAGVLETLCALVRMLTEEPLPQ